VIQVPMDPYGTFYPSWNGYHQSPVPTLLGGPPPYHQLAPPGVSGMATQWPGPGYGHFPPMPSNLGHATQPSEPRLSVSDYPLILPWLAYCDSHPGRTGDNFSSYAWKFETEGYRRINQLTSDSADRLSLIEKLSSWLSIGKGIADLLTRYAEEDIALIKKGTFSMDPVDNSDTRDV
jgi:hypothetical protein